MKTTRSFPVPCSIVRVRPWLKRPLLCLGLATLTLAATGFAYQGIGTALDQQRYPAPGKLISLGNHRLHIYEMGQHHTGPTVILESGLGGPSGGWAWVQPEVAKFARVVSYDRAGLGWSEDSDELMDARHTADRLYALLKAADIPGPYILVGHSIGGLYVRMFTDLYPTEVAGLVLVDPSHPDQLERFPQAYADAQQQAMRLYQASPWLARFGILRVTNFYGRMMNSQTLPAESKAATEAFYFSVTHLQNVAQESQQWDVSTAQVRTTGNLGDRPLIVLSANPYTDGEDEGLAVWQSLHTELANLSTRGQHRLVNGADHMSLLLNPDHAQSTIAAVHDVMVQIQN